MAFDIFVNCIVEFDGTGAPTGNISIDGHRHTVAASSLPRHQPGSGIAADKFTVAFSAFVDAAVARGAGGVTSLKLVTKPSHALSSALTCTHS